MLVIRILPLLCLCLFSFSAHAFDLPQAQSAFVIDQPHKQNDQLGYKLDLLEDKDASYSLDEVVALAKTGEFQTSLNRPEHSFGTTPSAWWVHFTLVNHSDQPQRLVLRQGYSLIDSLKLWENIDGHLQSRETGDMLPFSQREISSNALVFILNVAPKSTQTFFLRYQTSGALTIDLSLQDLVSFSETQANKQMLQGGFYGAVLALVLYNIFILFIVRDISYLLYVVYALTFGMFISSFSGYSSQYIWPESPWLANIGLLFFWGALVAMALVFSKQFLNLKFYSPRLNFIANVFITIALCSSVAAIFLPYSFVVNVLFLLAPPSYLLIMIAGYHGIKQGSMVATYFLAAWASLLVAAIIGTLLSAGIIPAYASYSPYIIEFGALIEMVLLSIALASRIRSLEQDTQTDGLTQLYNRRFFDTEFSRLLKLSRRQQRSVALLLIDIDFFKQFNDSFGHDQGDLVLQQVSQLLKKIARQTDYVCRYGGEEFAIILPDTDDDGAEMIAERMREGVEQLAVNERRVTISIGVAVYKGDSIDEAELFKNADLSLYEAKRSGRNKVIFFNEDLLQADA